MTMLIAGHETTAAVLTWAVFEISQKPELMRRVQQEIDDVRVFIIYLYTYIFI